MAKIRISELPELTSGSINTILVGNDNNTTYKIPLTVLTASVVQMLSESTDARLDLLEQFESEFLPFSSSVHDLIIAATNEQNLGHLTTTASFNAFTSSYQTDSASFNDRIKSGSVVAGTISSSAQISALGFITGVVDIDNYVTTASYNLDSASFNTRIENATNEQYLAGFATTQSVNNLSTSVDSRLDTLESFSSSADNRYVLSGSITQTTWDNISGKPNNLVSSSTQITEYGFISESVDISSLNSFTQSAEQRITNLEAATASYLTSLDGAISNSAQVDYNYILNTPNDIISSSQQILDLGFVTGSYVTINEYNSLTQSFNQITESYYTLSGSFGSIDFSGINAITESYLSFTQSYYSDSSSVDSRLNALETAVDIDNYVTTASYDIDSASFSSRIDAATNEQFLGGFATTSSVEIISASAWGAFQSASSYSSSLATAISASDAEYTSFSASLQSTITTLSTSVDSRLDILETFSASADTRYVEASETSSMAVSSSLYSVSASVSITSSLSHRTEQTDVYVKNVSGAQIDKGKVVRISGATGDNPLIVTASFLTEGQSANTLGITTENIPNDSFGYVITEGILLGVNTSGMNAGELLYLGSNGSFTTTPPTAPNHGVRLGEVLREQQNNGSIYVRVDNGSELGEAHNVVDTSTNSSYGDILMKSGSVWINDNTFSSSLDTRIKNITVGSASVPDGTISSSQQIETLGFITSSTPTDLSGLNTISSSYLDFTQSYYSDSSSFDLRILDLVNNTGSYETTGRGIISESVVTISETQPAVGVGNLWYDSNLGNLYLQYASGTWIDTSNGVIQTIINDGSVLTTASFNAWTASFTASVPAGTISSSTQITTFGFVSGSYETTGRGIISSSLQTTEWGYATTGSNTFNGTQNINGDLVVTGSITAQTLIFSSSVYHTTASYSSGSTIFGNTTDDTHLFTGSVSITGSLTASLQMGYAWVGNGGNTTIAFPTASLLSTASFNSFTSSQYNVLSASVANNQSTINALTASLGATSNAFSFIGVTNPTNLTLVSYTTSSFNGGVIDILAVNNTNSTATSTNYQFASYGANVGISQNGKQTSGAGAPNLAPTISVSGSNVVIQVTLTGTFNIKGVARLF